MSKRLDPQQLKALSVPFDPRPARGPGMATIDRGSGLPSALYGATAALYLGFLAVMGALFLNSGLAIPLVIFAGLTVCAFGLARKRVGRRLRPVEC